jgi:thiol-disulfide isomerase/thioredoxin
MWSLWRTRKIPQRESVLDYLMTAAPRDAEFAAASSTLSQQAALDPDANLRERALGLLELQKNPRFLDLAQVQLRDADPQIRLLGLQYLRHANDPKLLPIVLQTLNDPDPVVAVSADSILRQWTGNDFGIRVRDAMAGAFGDMTTPIEPDRLIAIQNATNKWNDWWQTNRSHYAAATPVSLSPLPREAQPFAADFALKNLAGQTVRLSDFKGKTVLLNFWTTWCTACQEEIPRLIALQKNHPDDLVILAISLDGAPVGDADEIEGKAGTSEDPLLATPAQIQEKIQRLIKTRGINYQILRDPQGDIGARFNGHELPTNVLIDSAGNVRRRFIGTRPAAALEAMFQNAASP